MERYPYLFLCVLWHWKRAITVEIMLLTFILAERHVITIFQPPSWISNFRFYLVMLLIALLKGLTRKHGDRHQNYVSITSDSWVTAVGCNFAPPRLFTLHISLGSRRVNYITLRRIRPRLPIFDHHVILCITTFIAPIRPDTSDRVVNELWESAKSPDVKSGSSDNNSSLVRIWLKRAIISDS